MVRNLNLSPIFSGLVSISYPLSSCSASEEPALSSSACRKYSDNQISKHSVIFRPASSVLCPSCVGTHSVSWDLHNQHLNTQQVRLYTHSQCACVWYTLSPGSSTDSSKVYIGCEVCQAWICQYIVQLVISESLNRT